MAHQIVNTTDYRNALVLLDQFLTNRHVSVIAINAGGTGYAVDDILTVLGGTLVGGMAATIEVTSVAAGVIDGARLLSWGAYSVDPSLVANAVTGGTGTGATFDLTMLAPQWTQRIANISAGTTEIEVNAAANTIGSGGTGYTVADVLTLNSTVANSGEATFTVQNVSGGVVTGITRTTGGNYTGVGAGNFNTTGGTGTGCTINPNFQPTRDEYWWEGAGTGGNPVFVGIRSGFETSNSQYLWDLAGGTGWVDNDDWEAQPGLSPGRNQFIDDGTSGTSAPLDFRYGNCMYTSNAAATMRIYASARRIIVVMDISGNIQSCHLGLLDPYGTDAEIPYPFYIAGTSDEFIEGISENPISKRGPADPTSNSSTSESQGKGPSFRDGSGTWQRVSNGNRSGSSIQSSGNKDFNMWPCSPVGETNLEDADQLASVSSRTMEDWIPINRTSTVAARFFPSPDSGGGRYYPIACTIMRGNQVNQHRAMGEVNGLYWVSAEDGLTSGDKITASGRFFRVFQMGANTNAYAHFAVEEV